MLYIFSLSLLKDLCEILSQRLIDQFRVFLVFLRASELFGTRSIVCYIWMSGKSPRRQDKASPRIL